MKTGRLLTFWRAAGPVRALLFAAACLLLLLACGERIAAADYGHPVLMFIPCFFIARLFSGSLIRFAGPILRSMQAVWVVLILSSIFRPAGGWFPGEAWVLFPVIGLYLGTVFWMLSDLRVMLALLVR